LHEGSRCAADSYPGSGSGDVSSGFHRGVRAERGDSQVLAYAGVAPGGEPTRTSGPPAGDATVSAVAADAPDLVRHLVNTGLVLTLIAAVLAGVAAAIVLAI
jgi:hypothetical protein